MDGAAMVSAVTAIIVAIITAGATIVAALIMARARIHAASKSSVHEIFVHNIQLPSTAKETDFPR
jgi:hypothetical protein